MVEVGEDVEVDIAPDEDEGEAEVDDAGSQEGYDPFGEDTRSP